jgi:hypothetical protein
MAFTTENIKDDFETALIAGANQYEAIARKSW